MICSLLGLHVARIVKPYCYNMSSVQLASNLGYHARQKHIEVHYHFIREMVISKKIDLKHVKSKDHVADIFTKSLGRDKFNHFKELLAVIYPT